MVLLADLLLIMINFGEAAKHIVVINACKLAIYFFFACSTEAIYNFYRTWITDTC